MVAPVRYYTNQTDALGGQTGGSGWLGTSNTSPLLSFGGFSRWALASNSTGTSPQNITYAAGASLNNDGSYFLYPASSCFKEGTKILCNIDGIDTYVPIETLKSGVLVKTSRDGYKKIEYIANGTIQNSGNDERIAGRLYKCSPANYPELKEDLYITGCHSILVGSLTNTQREGIIKELGKIFVTDNKYRLIASVDERAEPWRSEGLYTIWHLALENENEKMNYGVYVNGGLLVETCCIHLLKNKSDMALV